MTASVTPTLRIARTFDAPPERVWAAWTVPEELTQWWNPAPGEPAEVHAWDVRPGGAFRTTLRVPDAVERFGTDAFVVPGTFVRVDPPRELHFRVRAEEGADAELTIKVRLEPVPRGTRVTLEVTGDPGAAYREGLTPSWHARFGKLEDLIMADAADRALVMTRTFDAPRERVFAAWTDPAEVAQWWGPDGFTCTIHEMDARPGGVWRLTMHGPDGTDYPNRIVFDEVERPSRLAYTHGTNEQHPDEFRVRVTFEDEDGKTRLTTRMIFPSVDEMERVKKFGAQDGMAQTLSRLAQHVASA